MQGLFGNTGVTGQLLSTIAIYAIVIGGLYFWLYRPQQKKRKQEEENRQSWNHHSLPDPDDGAGRCNQQCYG